MFSEPHRPHKKKLKTSHKVPILSRYWTSDAKISALPEWDEEGGSLKVLSCHERRKKKKDTSVDLKRTVSDMETMHKVHSGFAP